nr:DNA polymerase III subunit alpha [Calditrichia bacterium]
DRKFGRQKIEYLHPLLEPILRETNGIIVYQEQVMRIASDLGGFSLGKADILRRAMGKKKMDLMAKMEVEFVDGCDAKGIDAKTAKEIYQLIFKFASYGFNKSHSAAYSILAYQTAYLKRHYPAEFMAASLTSEINDPKRIIILIDECKRMSLDVLPPDVNRSGALFEVPDPGKVSFGLVAIKNVGRGAIDSILAQRQEKGPVDNLFQFVQDLDLRSVNRKVLESLAQAGALDSMEGNRAQKFAAVEIALSFGQKFQEQAKNKSQISLFDMMASNGEAGVEEEDMIQYPTLPDIMDWPLQDKLNREKDLLGFYISGHPLDKYAREVDMFSNLDWQRPDTYRPGTVVTTGAMLSQVKTHMDRKGRFMAFVTFEDRFSTFEGIVFAGVYEKFGEHLKTGNIVFVRGKVDDQGEQTFKMLCDEIIPIGESRNRMADSVRLLVDTGNISIDQIDRLHQVIRENPGMVPVMFDVKTGDAGMGLLLRSKRFKVLLSDEFVSKVEAILGRGAVNMTA